MTPEDADTIVAVLLADDFRAADTMPAPVWLKSCGCGREFSEDEWNVLSFVGTMTDDVESIEMRNCPCGSTLARLV